MAFQTLAQLRAEAQQRCNQEIKTLVATADWARYINEAIAELYDLVITANPHYYVSQIQFTLSSVNTFDLTTATGSFYKLRGLDYLPSGAAYPVTVMPLNFQERNRFWNQNYQGLYTLWYTQPAPTLVNDSDTLDMTLNNWAEFIAVTAAIVAAIKEESPIDSLGAQKDAIMARIRGAVPNRDGSPLQASDLSGWNNRGESGRRYMLSGSNLIVVGGSYLDPWAI
jgi:hypothetical protein